MRGSVGNSGNQKERLNRSFCTLNNVHFAVQSAQAKTALCCAKCTIDGNGNGR